MIVPSRNPINVATFLQLQSFKSSAEARPWVAKHAEMVFPHREAKGITVPGESASLKLDRRSENLAADYLLFEEGARPTVGLARGAVVVGVLLVLVGGLFSLKKATGQGEHASA